MLFLNSRARNATVSGTGMRNQSYTHKMGHSFIICGCLSIITGLILIVIGLISEIKKTTFIGIGIISLGVGFFLTTLVCLYGKLDIYYNNWAYRTRILPLNPETPRPAPPNVNCHAPSIESPAIIQKRQSSLPMESQAAITVISDTEVQKHGTIPSIQADGTI